MHLIQLLLPLYDNHGNRLANALFAQVRDELVARFGGLTAHARAPASGLWQEGADKTVHDDLVIYEVMAETVDAPWWRGYRKELEQRFRQDELVIRAHPIARL